MKLTISEKVYDFEYRLNSMCELEREAGMSVGEVLGQAQYTMMRYMIWAGMLRNHPMTLIDAGELAEAFIAEVGIAAATKAISDAVSEAGFMTAQGKKAKR